MKTSIYEHIENIIPKERMLFDEPMSKHTTFRVGGDAACMILIEQEEELLKLVPYLNIHDNAAANAPGNSCGKLQTGKPRIPRRRCGPG